MAGLLASLAGKPALILTVAAGAVTGGLAATGILPLGGAEPEVSEPATLAALPEAKPVPEAATPTPEPAAVAPTPQPEAPAAATPRLPSFDVVRIEADGTALIAGSAEPAAVAVLSLDGDELIRSDVDTSGKFAAFLTIPTSAETQILTLAALVDGEVIKADDQVIVAGTPVVDAPKVAALEPETAAPLTPTAVEPAPEVVVEDTPVVTEADPAENTAVAETTAPAVETDIAEPQAPSDAPVVAEVEPTPMPVKEPVVADTAPADTPDDPVVAEVDAVETPVTEEPEVADTSPVDAPAEETVIAAAEVASEQPSQDAPVQEQTAPTEPEPTQSTDTPVEQPEVVEVTPVQPVAEPAEPELAATPLAQPQDVQSEEAPVVVASVEPTEPTAPDAPQPQAVNAVPTQPTAPASETATAAVNTAPTVFLAGRDGVKVLQSPRAPERGPAVPTSLALDSISYSDAGSVELAGRGREGGFVRVYLNNAAISTSRIAEDGSWEVDLPEVDTGVYTLRVDEVAADGSVKERVETPFKRESEEVLERAAERIAASDNPATAITVQPGSTLWAIAEDRYGSGVDYVRVFEANRQQIADPDLIYPGQVFAFPE